ncbi:MAG: hypothetical protein RI973_557, partial [Bacteroidota bacterium]
MVKIQEKQAAVVLPDLSPPLISGALGRHLVRARLLFQVFRRVYAQHRSILGSVQQMRALAAKNREHHQTGLMGKVAKVDGRYYWRLYSPGAPSVAARKIFDYEIALASGKQPADHLRLLMVGITKKCPLQCEHCYEWDNLNQREVLSRQDLVDIVQKFQQSGTSILWFGGGEPMMRLDDMIHVLEQAEATTDFWVVTSGYRLDEAAAARLKEAGLTGVVVSIDHHLPEQHNAFRHHPNAFAWAVQACENARKAGLVTALSLCATREFTTEDNLRQYMEMARRLGAAFVQLLEPKAVGHYAGRDVKLLPSQLELLEKLFLEYNTSPAFRDYPIVDYIEFAYRRVGCMGRGARKLYVDTNGN